MMGSLKIIFRLAWRNLWRNHRRTLIMLAAIVIGVWAMIFMTALIRGMVNDMLRESQWLHDEFTRVGATSEHAFYLRNDRVKTPLARGEREMNWARAAAVLPDYPFFRRSANPGP